MPIIGSLEAGFNYVLEVFKEVFVFRVELSGHFLSSSLNNVIRRDELWI